MRLTARSLPTRVWRSSPGRSGLVMKIVLLAIVNAIGVWAIVILAHHGEWTAAGITIAATAAIDAIYLLLRACPPSSSYRARSS